MAGERHRQASQAGQNAPGQQLQRLPIGTRHEEHHVLEADLEQRPHALDDVLRRPGDDELFERGEPLWRNERQLGLGRSGRLGH